MPRFEPDSELRRLAEALTALRRARGLSQAEAGARVGMTSQGWGLYEAARRPGLFRPDVQRRLTGALDATPESLALALGAGPTVAEAPADGVRSRDAAFAGPPAPAEPSGVERLQLSNDDLAPWAASGVVLELDPGRWPRNGQGCVIDLADGRRLVRLYQRADAERLYVQGGPGGLATAEVVMRADVRRMAAVTARRDL